MCECGTEQSVGRSIWPSGDASGGALKSMIDWEVLAVHRQRRE
jgi:hypothetical protein